MLSPLSRSPLVVSSSPSSDSAALVALHEQIALYGWWLSRLIARHPMTNDEDGTLTVTLAQHTPEPRAFLTFLANPVEQTARVTLSHTPPPPPVATRPQLLAG